MIAVVRARRIARGGYVPGAEALVAGPVFKAEPNPADLLPTLEQIEAEIAVRVQAARRQAYDEALRIGIAEGRRQIETEAALLRGICAQIEERIATVWDQVRQGVAELGLEIGRKIVGQAAEEHQLLAVELAKRGVAQAREQTRVTIFVNPLDAEALRSAEIDILKAGDGVRLLEVVERASVAPGGAIIECEVGQFDLRPDVQLEAVTRALEVENEE